MKIQKACEDMHPNLYLKKKKKCIFKKNPPAISISVP